ncbi:hypothetical protein BHM03_00030205 [Ensete ventricosum]|nr:hypothetical protein BHM03_00030205 [Ensete ventricosum]
MGIAPASTQCRGPAFDSAFGSWHFHVSDHIHCTLVPPTQPLLKKSASRHPCMAHLTATTEICHGRQRCEDGATDSAGDRGGLERNLILSAHDT